MSPLRYFQYTLIVFLLPLLPIKGLSSDHPSEHDNTISFKMDSSYQIISTYNSELKHVAIKFFLKDFSAVGLELYDHTGHMVKLWTPRLSNAGEYLSKLPVEDLPDGTYLLHVLINDDTFQQAVFKY